MIDGTCIGCTLRAPGCHSRCEKYINFRKQLDEINKKKNGDREYSEYVYSKNKRKKDRRYKRR